MKNLYKQKRQEGFTIIEVLIVLAIAAVILLIVFLAIPALQRNSRNNQRTSDVAAILAGVSDFAANNNGAFPLQGNSTYATGVLTLKNATSTSNNEVKVGYYQSGLGNASGDIAIVSPYAATGPFNTAANDRVAIVIGASCLATGATQAGGARQLVAVYETETGSSTYGPHCQAS